MFEREIRYFIKRKKKEEKEERGTLQPHRDRLRGEKKQIKDYLNETNTKKLGN